MNNDDQQLKEIHHPSTKYDYDGLTGTWLLIPAKFHLLMLAILLPIIIWVLPNIHFKGNYRYFLADYRYHLAIFVAVFGIASTLLSILKSKQVTKQIRPTNKVRRQIIAKTGPAKPLSLSKKPEKNGIHVGHIRPNEASPLKRILAKKAPKAALKEAPLNEALTQPVPSKKTSSKGPKIALKKSENDPSATAAKKPAKPAKASTVTPKKDTSTKAKTDTPKKRRTKKTEQKPEQMDLDL